MSSEWEGAASRAYKHRPEGGKETGTLSAEPWAKDYRINSRGLAESIDSMKLGKHKSEGNRLALN